MSKDQQARKAFPPQLQHLITYITKPKFKYYRGSSPAYVYELHTGYDCIDGLYPTQGEAMSAVLSEGLLITLLERELRSSSYTLIKETTCPQNTKNF